jgi:hypothetical protein
MTRSPNKGEAAPSAVSRVSDAAPTAELPNSTIVDLGDHFNAQAKARFEWINALHSASLGSRTNDPYKKPGKIVLADGTVVTFS